HTPQPPRAFPSFPPRRSSDLKRSSKSSPRPSGHFVWLGSHTVGRQVGVLCPLFEGQLGAPHRLGGYAAGPGKPGWIPCVTIPESDRKSTRLNSSHVKISYAVF